MTFLRKSLGLAISTSMTMSVFADVENNQVESVTTLDTIVVSASLKEQNIDKAPASISVVTSEDIERSAALSIAEVLENEAGVYNYNSGQDKVIIRGMRDTSGSYTLLLLNGKRMSSSGAMWRGNDFDWSAIPLNSIERIEVIRGPMSSLYGSDAMGGVINIITKKAKPGETSGSIFAQYNYVDSGTGQNQYRYGFNLNTGITDNLTLKLSGDANNRDAWYPSGTTQKDGAYFVEKKTKNIHGTLTWDINDQNTLDFDLNYNNDKRPLTQDSATGEQEMEMKRTNMGVTHHGHWDWGKTEAYLGYEHGKIHDYDSDYDMPQNRTYVQKNLIGRAFANFDWMINNTTAGFDYKNQKIEDVVSYQSGGNTQKSYGIFAQNDTHITDALTLTLGGRYDDFNNFDGKATGKAYLSYEIQDGIVIKGGVGQAYKAPSPYQLDPNYSMISCGGSCQITGNPDLKAEESTNYEVTFSIKKPIWHLSLTAFNNDIKNLIERTSYVNSPNPTLYPYQWNNVSKAQIRGIELSSGYTFTDNLSIKANATYLDAKNKENDQTLAERPEWAFNPTINWTLVDDFKVALGAHYVGHQVLSNGNELPSYTTYDISMTSNLTKDIILDYGVKNLTNVFLEDEDKSFNTKIYGRNYFVKLTYNF